MSEPVNPSQADETPPEALETPSELNSSPDNSSPHDFGELDAQEFDTGEFDAAEDGSVNAAFGSEVIDPDWVVSAAELDAIRAELRTAEPLDELTRKRLVTAALDAHDKDLARRRADQATRNTHRIRRASMAVAALAAASVVVLVFTTKPTHDDGEQSAAREVSASTSAAAFESSGDQFNVTAGTQSADVFDDATTAASGAASGAASAAVPASGGAAVQSFRFVGPVGSVDELRTAFATPSSKFTSDSTAGTAISATTILPTVPPAEVVGSPPRCPPQDSAAQPVGQAVLNGREVIIWLRSLGGTNGESIGFEVIAAAPPCETFGQF